MKVLQFVAMILFSINSYSQINYNENTKLFQYDSEANKTEIGIDQYEIKLIELGFEDIKKIGTVLYAKSFFTKMIYGSAMEIHYTIKIDDNKILLSNFKINDVRYGKVALEELKKSSQKRWIEEINSRVPEILEKLKN